MKKISVPHTGARKKQPFDPGFEVQIAVLFLEVRGAYNKSIALTEALRTKGHARAADETFETVILLKNALRICGDALSHLPS